HGAVFNQRWRVPPAARARRPSVGHAAGDAVAVAGGRRQCRSGSREVVGRKRQPYRFRLPAFLADASATGSGDNLAFPPPAGLPHGVFASNALNRPLMALLTPALRAGPLAASGWGCA